MSTVGSADRYDSSPASTSAVTTAPRSKLSLSGLTLSVVLVLLSFCLLVAGLRGDNFHRATAALTFPTFALNVQLTVGPLRVSHSF